MWGGLPSTLSSVFMGDRRNHLVLKASDGSDSNRLLASPMAWALCIIQKVLHY